MNMAAASVDTKKLTRNEAPLPAWRALVVSAAEAGTVRAVAHRLGATEKAVARWVDGERVPSARMQARILELLPEDAPAAKAEVPACRAATASVARAGITGRERFVAIVERLEAEIAACGANVPRNHVSSMYAQLQAAVEKLAKFDGDGELTVNQLLRSRAWAEVEGVLLEVLRRHPGAAEDLLGALDALRER